LITRTHYNVGTQRAASALLEFLYSLETIDLLGTARCVLGECRSFLHEKSENKNIREIVFENQYKLNHENYFANDKFYTG